MLFLFAAVLPALFWQGGVETAPDLRQAGITHIEVPMGNAAAWKNAAGISVHPLDLEAATKLPTPGVDLRTDEASASRIPWLTSNGWRFMRNPKGRYYYDVAGAKVTLTAAEAFCFANAALIKTDASGLTPLSKMLQFLRTINSDESKPLADIDFVDDGSSAAGEVMNLMIRDNLLFDISAPTAANSKRIVQLGSKDYPEKEVNDANLIVHKIRSNLGDSHRSIRIYGTSVVVTRLTAQPGGARLHLLNYGTTAHIRVGEFRVHVLGRFRTGQIHSFDTPGAHLLDYEAQADATEFTVPELKAYAVVDLSP
jgi:hypothetical protein